MFKQPELLILINPKPRKLFRPVVQRETYPTWTSKKVEIQLLIFQMGLILRSEGSARSMDE